MIENIGYAIKNFWDDKIYYRYDTCVYFIKNVWRYRNFLSQAREYDFRDAWLEVTATMLDTVAVELAKDDLHEKSDVYAAQAKKAAESARRATEDYWLEQAVIHKEISMDDFIRYMKKDEEILFNILRRKSSRFWC